MAVDDLAVDTTEKGIADRLAVDTKEKGIADRLAVDATEKGITDRLFAGRTPAIGGGEGQEQAKTVDHAHEAGHVEKAQRKTVGHVL